MMNVLTAIPQSLQNIALPTLLVLGISIVLGIMIVIVSHFFRLPSSEKKDAITEALPGANCGGCGFPGCEGYAEFLASGGDDITLCAVGGASSVKSIAEILGKEAILPEKKVCTVLCQGTQGDNGHTHHRYDYLGTQTCSAASNLLGGPNSCTYGCLGFGDCVNVCMFNAISKNNGIVKINAKNCTACGQCVKICPKQVLRLLPVDSTVAVLCQNKWPGVQTRKSCDIGCIGCKRCEKACPSGAITTNGPLAAIDQSKCTHCGACIDVCPTHAVMKICLKV